VATGHYHIFDTLHVTMSSYLQLVF